MQFDLFHIYTVDEHTLRVMLKLESFLAEDEAESHPICHQIFSQISDRTLLYVAALSMIWRKVEEGIMQS